MTTTNSAIELISRVTTDTEIDRKDTLARVTWSVISEPGDGTAGMLIRELGAEDALTLVLDARAKAPSIVNSDELKILRERVKPRYNESAASMALKTAARFGITLITPSHHDWSERLNDLGNAAPHVLWTRGDSSLLVDQTITAICGSRAATGYGEHVTMELAAGLTERGHTIISGGGYGVDGMAHRAALANEGRTIAVLAGGADRYYPSGHEALLNRIAAAGVVVSELPAGTPPTKWRFLQRNRLTAALADAVVITEAGWRSGCLNTAGHASALGRPLGAVPGPVTSAASAGCHRLIRDFDATLVTNAEEAAMLQAK